MDKMREEFEEWYASQVSDDNVVQIDLWSARKASRDAMCVELPEKMNPDAALSMYDVGFNDGIDGAMDCIEQTGVNCK